MPVGVGLKDVGSNPTVITRLNWVVVKLGLPGFAPEC